MDTSWISNEQQLIQLHHHCLPEQLTSITLECLYVNSSNILDSFERETISLANSSSITKEQLISLVQSHKKVTPMTNYVFKELSLFHIHIPPERLASFNDTEISTNDSFFHTFSATLKSLVFY